MDCFKETVVRASLRRTTRFGTAQTSRWLLLLACFFASQRHTPADESPPETGVKASPASPVNPDVEQRQAQVARRKEKLQQELTDAADDQELGRQLRIQMEMLNYVELLLSQQKNAAQANRELSTELRNWEKEIEDLRRLGPVERPPFSFLLLEELRASLGDAETKVETLSEEVDALQTVLDSLHHMRDDAERNRRSIKSSLQSQHDEQEAVKLARELATVQLRCELATEGVSFRQAELQNRKLEMQSRELQVRWLEERIELIAKEVRFSPEDLQTALRKLAQEERELKQRLATLSAQLPAWHEAWEAAQIRQETAESNDPLEAAQARAVRTTYETGQKELSLINQRLAEIVAQRFFWQCRFQLSNRQASRREAADWRSAVDDALMRQERLRTMTESQADQQRDAVAETQSRLRGAAGEDRKVVAILEQQCQDEQRLLQAYAEYLVRNRLNLRFLEGFAEELTEHSTWKNLQDLSSSIHEQFTAAWDYELVAIEDNPVTVGKLASAILLLASGYTASRLISRLVGRRLLPRLGAHDSVSRTLQSISFYVLLISFGYLSLEVVHFPLTVFTFLGGAAAIGVGFGSQNLMNNFISGLILQVERPIRVGDLVEIDGLSGTIDEIGGRSTRVRTGANLEIVIPNSKFLENSVTNWTLSDTRIRSVVRVGVAYGSPTAQVMELILEAARDHKRVLSDPPPFAVFKNFGDNTLDFEVLYWVKVRSMTEAEVIASDIRLRIDQEFRGANISIAFPQRDVHLDTVRPIDVRISGLQDLAGNASLRRAA